MPNRTCRNNVYTVWSGHIYRLSSVIFMVSLTTYCAHQHVSFKQDVSPILEKNCVQCHTAPNGVGYKKTGLEMYSYDSLMQGTIYGAVIVAGDSRRSILNKMIEGRAGEMLELMHKNGIESLSDEEVAILRDWVDQGAMNN